MSTFCIKMLVLPRQARDNHGEKSETNNVLCRGLVSPPPSELSRWRDVLQNLAPIPVGEAISPPNTSVLLPQEWPIFTFPDEKHDNPVRKLLLVSSLPDICPESVCLGKSSCFIAVRPSENSSTDRCLFSWSSTASILASRLARRPPLRCSRRLATQCY
jgi:hypothetical protein